MSPARYPRLPGILLALGLVWGAGAAAPVWAQEEQRGASSEPTFPKDLDVEFERLTLTDGGNYEFIGPVTIRWRESRIQADRITLTDERYISAQGNVLVVWGDNFIFGTAMEYDLETERGFLTDALGQVQGDYIFWAKHAEKIGEEQVRLRHAKVTTCTQPNPYWSFAVTSATIRVESYARMWNVLLRAGKVPFFYLPYLIWPVKEDRAVGLLMPNFESTNERGHAISQQLFIPLGRSADLTLLGRYYTEAGFGGGGEFRFVPNSRGSAALSGFYIADKVSEANRYTFSYKQAQQFRNGFRMIADINMISDFDFYTDFARELNLISSPQIVTRVEFSRNGPWTSLNVRELRRKQLFFDGSQLVQQSLPEVEWRGRSKRLGRTPIYLAFESSLGSIQQREKASEINPSPPFDADYWRADLFPTVSVPLNLVPWLDVTPLVSYRWSYYTQHQRDYVDGQGQAQRAVVDEALSRELFSAGLEIIGPKIYRVYERPDSPFSARYKHAIETRFIWGYAESFDRLNEIIPFDEVDRVSGAGNQVNYALVQRLFAARPRTEPPTITPGTETIVLPDGTESRPELEPGGSLGPSVPVETPDDPEAPREPVEIASLELYQTRSFDRELSFADLDRDGTNEETSPYSDIVLVGRYNPSPSTSIDLRTNYHVLYSSIGGATLSGGIRRRLAQIRFSIVHRNGLAVAARDDTQLRLTTGFNLLQGRLRLDLDGSFVFHPLEGQKKVPDRRWRVQYSTQCCTFVFEHLRREFALASERDDFYFRVDLKGVGKLLDFNY